MHTKWKEKKSIPFFYKVRKIYAVKIVIFFISAVLFVYSVLSDVCIKKIKYYLSYAQYSICSIKEYLNDDMNKYDNVLIENIRLKAELNSLKQAAIENEELKQIIKLEKNNEKNIIGRVISVSSVEYSSSIMVNVGKNNGVQIDDVVINEHGLIGRVVDISDNWCSVLLTTDGNANTPVIFKNNGHMAVVKGTNNNYMKVSMKHGTFDISAGDSVITSGYGGIYKEGISVGIVNKNGMIDPCFNINKLRFVCIIGHLEY